MNRDKLLRQWLPESISLNPIGRNAEEIWIEEFDKIYLQFFDSVMEIQKVDISSLRGFGELTENQLLSPTRWLRRTPWTRCGIKFSGKLLTTPCWID